MRTLRLIMKIVYNYIQIKIFIMVEPCHAIKCRCQVYGDLILEINPIKPTCTQYFVLMICTFRTSPIENLQVETD